MLPGGGPWEKELRGSETSAHVSGGDSGPDPERASAKARTWVSSRRQRRRETKRVCGQGQRRPRWLLGWAW